MKTYTNTAAKIAATIVSTTLAFGSTAAIIAKTASANSEATVMNDIPQDIVADYLTPDWEESTSIYPIDENAAMSETPLPDTGSVEPEQAPMEVVAEPVEVPEHVVEAAEPTAIESEPVPMVVEEPAIEPAWEEASLAEDAGWCEEPVSQGAHEAVPGTAGMSDDELSMAYEIFDRYNDWREAQGLSRTAWDGVCAEMAVNSSKGCAEHGTLIHRLGIPVECQLSYSDILQYASWRMTGEEAVGYWESSAGHNAQMRCPSARNAAVGVYFDEERGIYWFAIAYTFVGTNVG